MKLFLFSIFFLLGVIVFGVSCKKDEIKTAPVQELSGHWKKGTTHYKLVIPMQTAEVPSIIGTIQHEWTASNPTPIPDKEVKEKGNVVLENYWTKSGKRFYQLNLEYSEKWTQVLGQNLIAAQAEPQFVLVTFDPAVSDSLFIETGDASYYLERQ